MKRKNYTKRIQRFWIRFSFILLFSSLHIPLATGQINLNADTLIEQFDRSQSQKEKLDYFRKATRQQRLRTPITFSKHVQAWSNDLNLDSVEASSYFWIAENLFYHQGLTDSGLNQAKKGLDIREDIGSPRLIGWGQNQVGFMLYRMGLYSQANEYLLKAISSFQESKSVEGQLRALTSLGILNAEQNNFSLAISDFREALRIASENNDSLNILYANNNIGGLFLDSIQYTIDLYRLDAVNTAKQFPFLEELALPKLKTALRLAQTLKLDAEIARANLNLGQYYIYRNQFEDGYQSYKASLSFQVLNGRIVDELLINNNLGHAYLKEYKLTENLNTLDSSRKYLYRALELGKAEPELTRYGRRLLYSNLQEYYIALGNIDSAYQYLHQSDTLNQVLFNLEKEREIQNARGRYEYEKNQRTISDQQTKLAESNAREARKNLILGILSVTLMSAIAILIINRSRLRAKALVAQKEYQLVNQRMTDLIRQSELRTINALLEGQEKERERLSQELHDSVGAVLSAIKLHFTGLHSQIQGIEQEFMQTFERGTELLDVAVEEVRRISHNMTTGILRKFGLVASLNDLKDTLVGTGQIDFQVFVHGMDDRLEGQLEINLYRVVQELVSNTLKHAQARTITVEINRRDDSLNLMISDDGKGFDVTSIQSDGIGLQNMHNRVEKLGGHLHIDSTPGRGTTAVIDIPLSDE